MGMGMCIPRGNSCGNGDVSLEETAVGMGCVDPKGNRR